MSEFSLLLKELRACPEARRWVGNRTLKQMYKAKLDPQLDEYIGADWLEWLLEKMNVVEVDGLGQYCHDCELVHWSFDSIEDFKEHVSYEELSAWLGVK